MWRILQAATRHNILNKRKRDETERYVLSGSESEKSAREPPLFRERTRLPAFTPIEGKCYHRAFISPSVFFLLCSSYFIPSPASCLKSSMIHTQRIFLFPQDSLSSVNLLLSQNTEDSLAQCVVSREKNTYFCYVYVKICVFHCVCVFPWLPPSLTHNCPSVSTSNLAYSKSPSPVVVVIVTVSSSSLCTSQEALQINRTTDTIHVPLTGLFWLLDVTHRHHFPHLEAEDTCVRLILQDDFDKVNISLAFRPLAFLPMERHHSTLTSSRQLLQQQVMCRAIMSSHHTLTSLLSPWPFKLPQRRR